MTRYPAPVRSGLADHLVEHVVAAILRGDHPPDSRLPPEDRLAELFKVSRLTVREAVKALRGKGVVRVEQGRGTFVNQPDRWSPLDPDLLMARVGSAEGTRDLAVKLTEARRLVEVGVAGMGGPPGPAPGPPRPPRPPGPGGPTPDPAPPGGGPRPRHGSAPPRLAAGREPR